MPKWLAIVSTFAVLLGEGAASAQMKGPTPAEIAGVARTRAVDLRITQRASVAPPQLLVGGMLMRKQLAPNATVGLGLANLYGRKKSGSDMRINGGPGRGRKPAVTFVLKF